MMKHLDIWYNYQMARPRKNSIKVGAKHGHLTVLSEIGRSNTFECLCDCGNKATLRAAHFSESRKFCSRSCPLLSEHRRDDLTGQRFERWTVTHYVGRREDNHSLWHVRCDCGTERDVTANSLNTGETRSCGCYLKDLKSTGRTPEEELEVRRLRSRLSNRKNPARIKANKIKYETKRKLATPPWTTKEDMMEMNAIYEQAWRLTRETGIRHEVDHIIPIQGENVSGLHVPSNLQILTQPENVSKSNIYAELMGDHEKQGIKSPCDNKLINSSTFPFWQNVVQDANSPLSGGGAVTPSASTIEGLMLDAYLEVERGGDNPDLIVASNNYYTFYDNSQTSQKRYASEEGSTSATGGFVKLRYRQADVIHDGGSGIPDSHMYFINTDYLELVVHRDADMTQLDDQRAVNQDAVVMPIIWMGNLVCSNRSLQAVLLDNA